MSGWDTDLIRNLAFHDIPNVEHYVFPEYRWYPIDTHEQAMLSLKMLREAPDREKVVLAIIERFPNIEKDARRRLEKFKKPDGTYGGWKKENGPIEALKT